MRLNKQVKEAILAAALEKAGIPAKEMAIRSRVAEWAKQVHERIFTPDIIGAIEKAREIMAPVTELNANFYVCTYTDRYMDVNVAGARRRVFFNGNLDRNGEQQNVQKYCPYQTPVLTADDPLTEQLYAIDADKQTLRESIDQITASVNAVLNSVTTDKKLIEVWPEAIAFIPAAERAATVQLPALPIADLNKMIGLP